MNVNQGMFIMITMKMMVTASGAKSSDSNGDGPADNHLRLLSFVRWPGSVRKGPVLQFRN